MRRKVERRLPWAVDLPAAGRRSLSLGPVVEGFRFSGPGPSPEISPAF